MSLIRAMNMLAMGASQNINKEITMKIVQCFQWGDQHPTNIRRKDILGVTKEMGKTVIILFGGKSVMFVRDSVDEIQAQL
jgi:hypothetical protein